MIYNKLYTKRINFPKLIPQKGLQINDDAIESNYFILLEKNYFPISANISIKKIEQSGTTDWLSPNNIKFTVHDNYYNKLSIKGNINENNNTEKNTILFEFSANISDENTIEPCNTLLCYFEQAPKEEINACIEFEPYAGQTINDNTLLISGDAQYVRFYYYGVNNINGITSKIISQNNVTLTLNGEDLIEDNIISRNITSNGIEIIYKIDEFIYEQDGNNTRNFVLTCEYKTEFNTISVNKTITQNANVYNIDIVSISNQLNNQSLSYNDDCYDIDLTVNNIVIEYKATKNNNPITNNVQLQISPILNAPEIQYTIVSTTFDTTSNSFKTILRINKNFSDKDFYLQLYAYYLQNKTDIVKLKQLAIQLNQVSLYVIKEDEQTNLIGNQSNPLILTGASQRVTFKYFAIYDNYQFINSSYVLNGIKYDNFINIDVNPYIVIENEIINDPHNPYRKLTLDFLENTGSQVISNYFSVKLYELSGNVYINQEVGNILWQFDNANSTKVIGGLDDPVNNIIIKVKCNVNNKPITDVNKINISVASPDNYQDYINFDNLTKIYDGVYLIFKIPRNGYYGIEAIENNDFLYSTINLNFVFKYDVIDDENKIGTFLVKRRPVYFDLSFDCKDLTTDESVSYDYDISGMGETVKLYYHGIIYNHSSDFQNYAYDLNYENFEITAYDQDNTSFTPYAIIESNHIFSLSDLMKNVEFQPNFSDDEISVFIKNTYKRITKILEFKLHELAITLLFNVVRQGALQNGTELLKDLNRKTNMITLNTLQTNVIECCAEFIDQNGNPIPMDNDRLSIESLDTSVFTVDASNGRFKMSKVSSYKTDNKEYLKYYIYPHFNPLYFDKSDPEYNTFTNLPNTKINYQLTYNYDVNDDGEIEEDVDIIKTLNRQIIIKKNNLTPELFISFNSNIEQESVFQKNITNNTPSVEFYCIYSYYNEETNQIYYDSNISNYIFDVCTGSTITLSNYVNNNTGGGGGIIDNGGNPILGGSRQNAKPVGPSISGDSTRPDTIPQNALSDLTCTYDNTLHLLKFNLRIPQNKTENTKELGFTIKYNNKNIENNINYYDVKGLTEKMTITQSASVQELIYNFSNSINYSGTTTDIIDGNTQQISVYNMSGNITTFNIYIKTLLNNDPIKNQETGVPPNLTITQLNTNDNHEQITTAKIYLLDFVSYDNELNSYLYKLDCEAVASKTDKKITLRIKWVYDNKTNVKYCQINQRAATNLELVLNVINTVPATQNILNIEYYMKSDNIIFDPATVYANNEYTLALSGEFYSQEQTSNPEPVTFNTITTENKKYKTTYQFLQNTGLKTNKLKLYLTYSRNGYENDSCNATKDIIQMVANMEYCLDLSITEITDGEPATLYVYLYYKLDGVIYALPENIQLQYENVSWLHLSDTPVIENNKIKYTFIVDDFIETNFENYDPYFARECLFSYTINGINISKNFKQYQKLIQCIINYELLQ